MKKVKRVCQKKKWRSLLGISKVDQRKEPQDGIIRRYTCLRQIVTYGWSPEWKTLFWLNSGTGNDKNISKKGKGTCRHGSFRELYGPPTKTYSWNKGSLKINGQTIGNGSQMSMVYDRTHDTPYFSTYLCTREISPSNVNSLLEKPPLSTCLLTTDYILYD